MMKTEESSGPRRALGRGLSALLPPRPTLAVAPGEPGVPAEQVQSIPVELIDANPYQPRRIFDAEKLEGLAQSIRSDGLIQPIVVRRNGPRYTLVVGERRWRAARLVGMGEIPAVVKDIPADRLLEVTLIENVQREDLNPIEAALAFDRMVREIGFNHEEVANRTGKDRATITNLLRLLRLPADIQLLVAERRISMGHAKAILGLPIEEQQRLVAERTAAQGLSVRQVEQMVQRMTEQREVTEKKGRTDPNVTAALREMEQALGTRVRLVEKGENRGRIEIEYYSADDLERIYSAIVKS